MAEKMYVITETLRHKLVYDISDIRDVLEPTSEEFEKANVALTILQALKHNTLTQAAIEKSFEKALRKL